MITDYEHLEQFAFDNDVMILSNSLPKEMDGYYYSNTEYNIKSITLSDKIETTAHKTCVLAEEIEHYITTPFNLFEMPKALQDRYERIAKLNATQRLMPIEKLIRADKKGVCDQYELADFLNLTVDFVTNGLTLYRDYYGISKRHLNYTVYFIPFKITCI